MYRKERTYKYRRGSWKLLKTYGATLRVLPGVGESESRNVVHCTFLLLTDLVFTSNILITGAFISSKKNTPNKYQVNVPLKDKIPDFFSS